jgi:hypothetical protein
MAAAKLAAAECSASCIVPLAPPGVVGFHRNARVAASPVVDDSPAT